MSTAKPITPYERLRRAAFEFRAQALYRSRTLMWRYPADKINEAWPLGDLAQRVQAAEQLGHEVLIRWVAESGLAVEYRKKPDANVFGSLL